MFHPNKANNMPRNHPKKHFLCGTIFALWHFVIIFVIKFVYDD